MAGLYKKEIVVKPTSTATKDQAITATRNFVNGFQNASTNKDGNGNFIDYFFGDCYDSRNGNIYRVFSDACATYYSMPHDNGLIKYDVINNDVLALKSEIPSVDGLATTVYVDSAVGSIVVPSIDGLATTTYVDDAIAGIDAPEVDMTAVNNTLSAHDTRITELENADAGQSAFIIE